MTTETVAAKLRVSAEKIEEWESGTYKTTIRQAQALAKAYKRPFALMFLEEIPKDFKPLRDFRAKGSKPLSTATLFIIREIQQKQAWISEVLADEGEPKAEFVGRFSLTDDPATVARDILQTFEIDPSNYQFRPIKEWIDKAESNGIFISRTSFIHSRMTLDSEEFQGFAIADPQAPFVFINSDDFDAPQLFTLVHELAHLWIAETGISNDIEPSLERAKDSDPVELFCNEVAALALMPDGGARDTLGALRTPPCPRLNQ